MILALALLAAAGVAAAFAGKGSSHSAATPQHGGSITIARIEDSQSFDKTNVFQNESIWLAEQIMEPLYTVTADGKSEKPWLATSYKMSNGGKTYTFKLRQGVKFSNGQPMTSADVKFSLDDARAQSKGWGFLDTAIKNITAPSPDTVVVNLKYKWAPFLADIALFANGIIPNHFAGQTRKAFYSHPIGTGPFMWDKRVVGQSVTFQRNPNYWQKGKPYLDSVTWTYVTDENTRGLQLQGNQIQVDEFPPFNSISKLQHTNGVTMTLFPSTRTDYLVMNEQYAPLADVHVRRAISYAIDRQAIIKSVLFGYGKPANSFLPPEVPFYSPNAGGLQFNMAQAKAEMAKSKYPNGFKVSLLVGAGAQVEAANGQILQNELKPLGIDVDLQAGGHLDRVQRRREAEVPAGVPVLDDGHRRPGRARHLRGRPGRRSTLVLHRLQQRRRWSSCRMRRSARRTSPSGRSSTRSSSSSLRTTRSWASCTTRPSAMRTRASSIRCRLSMLPPPR